MKPVMAAVSGQGNWGSWGWEVSLVPFCNLWNFFFFFFTMSTNYLNNNDDNLG